MHVVLYVIILVIVFYAIHYTILVRIKNGDIQFIGLISTIAGYELLTMWLWYIDFLYR